MKGRDQLESHISRIALVLGGGGLKGFAHIGVLRALDERGILPVLYAGTSIGALIAASRAGGMSVTEMAERARVLRRRDLFRINHLGMIMERMRAPSLYLEEPLRVLCDAICPRGTFEELRTTLLVNTVDIERGTQMVWGLPGLRHVSIADAVYASCALPGFFPPGRVDGRICVDGGTIDNMPVAIAAVGMDAVIAVDVGNSDLTHSTDVATQGFASIYMRAASVMMHALQEEPLAQWQGPPMLLIRPRVSHHGWFSFSNAAALIRTGYEAAVDALNHASDALQSAGGVHPRRRIRLLVDRDRCIGCRTCVGLAPSHMAMDGHGKAIAREEILDWSPADGEFVRHCPTSAIIAEPVGQEDEQERPRRAVAPGDIMAAD
ncbi:MAG: patatin-like phospholipase family protein [Gemmatimonadaceae bacterium]